MINRWLTIGVTLLLASLLVTGCAIPQEEHDAVLAERDAAKSQVVSLQTDLAGTKIDLVTVQSELTATQSDLANVESDLAAVQSQLSSVQSDLNKTRGDLAEVEAQLGKMEAVFGILLFFDDFEGVSEGWDLAPGWSVIQEDDNHLLQGVGHVHAFIKDSQYWTDFTLETRIKLIKGMIHVNFRRMPDVEDYYTLNIYPTVCLSKNPEYPVIADSKLSLRRGIWNDLKVEVIGGSIKVYINGVLEIDYTDPESLESGSINLESAEDSKVQVDDVLVTRAK